MTARAFKSDCGCEATLIHWSSKRNMLSVKQCPLHKAAKELLETLKDFVAQDIPCPFRGNDGRLKDFVEWYKRVTEVIAKAERRES